MYGINIGFEIAKRALLAQQFAINVTGHNIANVNTPGYTRQNIKMASTYPIKIANAYGGTGVEATGIRRMRSLFLDTQFRKENQGLGRWENLDQTWSQIEMIFNEPSDSGLSQMMSDFWSAWQDLADDPESMSAKTAVKEKASTVIDTFHSISGQLTDLKDTLNSDINSTVFQINGYLQQIADLNSDIVKYEVGGETANDLRDKRDYLVDELSGLVNVRTQEEDNGAITVYAGSVSIINQGDYVPWETKITSDGDSVKTKIVLSTAHSVEINVTDGKLKGLIEARDEIIPEKLQQLNDYAAELVSSINAVHSAGYTSDGSTGINFFNPLGITADTIQLSDEIKENADNIAISQDGSEGDNSNILAILALKDEKLMDNGTSTFDDYYNSLIGEIGSRAQEASNLKDNHDLLVSQIQYRQQAVSGVSLDEEMANMISYQNAYNAAAKIIDTMDSMIDTLLNTV